MLLLLHVAVPASTFQVLHFLMRKSAHVTEYAILGMLIYFSLNRSSNWSKRTGWWAIAIAGAYSLSDEFHQLFVPGRGPAIHDSAIDTCGAALGILAVYLSSRLIRKKVEPSELQPTVPPTA